MCAIAMVLASILVQFHGPAWAQDAAAEPLEISESGEAYLRALRLSRIETDVVYFNPDFDAPALETDFSAPPENEVSAQQLGEGVWTLGRILFWVSVAVVLVAAFFAIRYFGGSLALRDGATNATVGTPETPEPPVLDGEVVIGLDEALALKDRRLAIIALTRWALNTALTSRNIIPQRSWTAREALRRVADAKDGATPLHDLVRASEGVQFGDRDISHEEFDAHVSRIRPYVQGIA